MGIGRAGTCAAIAAAMLVCLLAGPLAGQEPPLPSYGIEEGSLLLTTEDTDGLVPAPVLSSDTRMLVTDTVVRTKVTQTFLNPASTWVEGVYVFPLPAMADVDSLRMLVGGRIVEKQIPNPKDSGTHSRNVSLDDSDAPNLFTTEIANIGPAETIEVGISYQHRLRYDTDELPARPPVVVRPRTVPGEGEYPRSDEAAPAEISRVPDASRIAPPIALPGDEPRISSRCREPAGARNTNSS